MIMTLIMVPMLYQYNPVFAAAYLLAKYVL